MFKCKKNHTDEAKERSIISSLLHYREYIFPIRIIARQKIMADIEIIKEGWMRKRGSRVKTIWGERYFSLRGSTLYYYLKATDTEPKGHFVLQSNCKISQIRSDVGKKKKQFVFDISWPPILEEREEGLNDDKDNNRSPSESRSPSKETKRKTSKKRLEKDSSSHTHTSGTGSKVAALAVGGVVVGALTAGIGLIAGMMVVGMGAAASGSAVAMNQSVNEKEKQIYLACDSFNEAELWVHALEGQIRALGDGILGHGYGGIGGHGKGVNVKAHVPPKEVKLEDVQEWINASKWKVYSIKHGLRIFQQVSGGGNSGGIVDKGIPCLKVCIGVNGSVSDVFMLVMNFPPRAGAGGVVRGMRVVEVLDNCTDVVHLVFDPVFLNFTWTAPRDFCLMRYWKQNSDGSYAVCLDSVFHQDCPLLEGHVRGDFHGAYLISPPKEEDFDEEQVECLLTLIAQVDPKGWIWTTGNFKHTFLEEFLLHVLDVRDTVDAERFVQVHFDPVAESNRKLMTVSNASTSTFNAESGTIGTIPPPALSPEMWGEPDASTFKIRGSSYMQDKVKASSAPSLFKLVAVDVFEVPEATHNIAAHPRNRVSLAAQRQEKAWVFIVNIMVPGPPFLSFVMYFQGDKALFEQDTAFARVAKPFFFGNDDEFRNNRFKLIPKVIDGNMIIKMAVKDTPTLLGNKLKQYYYKDDHYFELDVDVGSSSVARNVVGLAIGYSKAIVVDMGICLQGNDDDELPEVLIGACTCIKVDMSLAKKL